MVAAIAPTRTGMRLVAFAAAAGRPIAIRIGKVTADPDEATVLRKPQTRPATTTTAMMSGLRLMMYVPLLMRCVLTVFGRKRRAAKSGKGTGRNL